MADPQSTARWAAKQSVIENALGDVDLDGLAGAMVNAAKAVLASNLEQEPDAMKALADAVDAYDLARRIDAYDPPQALEGPNTGLQEAIAARLWAERVVKSGAVRKADWQDFARQSAAVKASWRQAADRILAFMLEGLGFEGPAGPPRKADTGWSYAWQADVDQWEIIDDKGGAVALVMHNADLAMLVQAPAMAAGIRALLEAIAGTPAAEQAQIKALAATLPQEPRA